MYLLMPIFIGVAVYAVGALVMWVAEVDDLLNDQDERLARVEAALGIATEEKDRA